MPFLKNDRIWWTDPDEDICSGPGTIIDVRGDMVFVKKDDACDVEALKDEIRPLNEQERETYQSPFSMNDRIWWTDPDGDTFSGPGTVIRFRGDSFVIEMDDTGEADAWKEDIRHLSRQERQAYPPPSCPQVVESSPSGSR